MALDSFEPSHPLVADMLPDTVSHFRDCSRRVRQNAHVLKSVPLALEARRAAFNDPEHVEQQLYSGGFISRHDSALMARFHMAEPTTRLQVLEQMQDERLRILGQRILFEETPAVLPLPVQAGMTEELKARLHPSEPTPWTSVTSAHEEIAELMDGSTPEQQQLLTEYSEFLADLPRYFPQAA